MKTWPIPDNIADQYHGAGIALAAVTGGRVMKTGYIRDVIDEFDDEAGRDALRETVLDARLGPALREMQALGAISIGMCSCWEFSEL